MSPPAVEVDVYGVLEGAPSPPTMSLSIATSTKRSTVPVPTLSDSELARLRRNSVT